MAAPLRAINAPSAWAFSPAKGLAIFLALLAGMPIAWVALSAIDAGLNTQAWADLLGERQFPAALALTVGTGLAATALSWLLAAWLLSRSFPGPHWAKLVRSLGPLLAVPHAAFAIGLVFLIAPSGWLLRLLSPWATGMNAPPPWPTTQDPWGVGLVVVLVAKEVPFLLWAAATQMQRSDAGLRWERELQLARSMGYTAHTAWWQVVWPPLWQRMWGPTLAVLAYSLTVVDMALVIGPGSPPTLAVLAWQWLSDGDVAVNAKGATAAWALAATVAVCALALWSGRQAVGRLGHSEGRRGKLSTRAGKTTASKPWEWLALVALYAGVMLALAVGSVSGVWPFPDVWPQTLTLQAWESVAQSTRTLGTTALLGLCASITALVWSVAWLECAPPKWDASLRKLIYLPLVLPSVLWVVGLHRLALDWGMEARATGLWLAHSLAALPYVLIALSPAYMGFDARLGNVAASLGRSQWAFLLRVKWPLLKASMAAALAVGLAVSVAQFLPTLYVGAGRFATVTTEAVTLASGAQRSLTSAYAWLQWMLPALGFALAAWVGRPRRFAGQLKAQA